MKVLLSTILISLPFKEGSFSLSKEIIDRGTKFSPRILTTDWWNQILYNEIQFLNYSASMQQL